MLRSLALGGLLALAACAPGSPECTIPEKFNAVLDDLALMRPDRAAAFMASDVYLAARIGMILACGPDATKAAEAAALAP